MPGPDVAIVDAYPHLRGGAQRTLEVLAPGLVARGRRVVVVVPAEGPSPDELRRLGVPVEVVEAPAGLRAYGRTSRPAELVGALPGWWRRLAGVLRRLDVDVVHAHDHRGLLLAGPAAAAIRRPVVWHLHALQPPSRADAAAARAVAAVVLPSHRVLATHGGYRAARRLVEVPNPCLLDLAATPAAQPATAPPRIATVARLHPDKGLDVLVAALALVREAVPDAELVVAGGDQPGSDVAGELAALAARLGVGGAVQLLGHVDAPAAVLGGAAVYAQPSRPGGDVLPLSVIDAAGLGLPVVASAVGAMADLVVDGTTGHLVAPGDPAALADRLVALLRDRATAARMGAAGAARIAARHAPGSYVERIARVHDAVVR